MNPITGRVVPYQRTTGSRATVDNLNLALSSDEVRAGAKPIVGLTSVPAVGDLSTANRHSLITPSLSNK